MLANKRFTPSPAKYSTCSGGEAYSRASATSTTTRLGGGFSLGILQEEPAIVSSVWLDTKAVVLCLSSVVSQRSVDRSLPLGF